MADAFVSFAVQKLGDFLIQQVSLRTNLRDEVRWLRNELLFIQSFLRDAEQKQCGDQRVQQWVFEINSVANDAVAILETYSFEAGKGASRLKACACICRKEKKFYNVAEEIQSLKQRIIDISRRRETYGITNINNNAGEGPSNQVRTLRRTTSYVDEDHIFVGFQDVVQTLLAQLLKAEPPRSVVSIYGMGGLGKTTLARNLYRSPNIISSFPTRTWICVSQEYNKMDLLKTIIKSIQGRTKETLDLLERMTERDLEIYHHDLLKERKYLVVVDDVWQREAWESLKRAFPDSKNGSRVIITMRKVDVAERADDRGFVHKLRFLSPEESWDLFCRKLLDVGAMVPEMESLAKDMVEKCRGLALAIVVLSGLLSHKRGLDEWQKVKDHLWKNIIEDKSIEISNILSLSYNDLSTALKQCFLYFGTFPEDKALEAENIIWLWMAEGFIPRGEERMEDVAEGFLNELIRRSLVQVAKTFWEKVTECRVHDLLRDLAIQKALEVNFFDIYDTRYHSISSSCIRHAIHSQGERYLSLDLSNLKLRSIMFFDHDFSNTSLIKFSSVFRHLYVLYLDIEVGITPDAIGSLYHLKFLHLRGVNYIPPSIGNLKNLQTLHAKSNFFSCHLPPETADLINLRHLVAPYSEPLKRISKLTSLQVLKDIYCDQWKDVDPVDLVNLRELSMINISNFYSLNNISSLKNLSTLRLSCPGDGPFPSLEFVNCCEKLQKLFLYGRIEKLPDLFSNSITMMVLEYSELIEDPMPNLGMLPNLRDLQLRGAYKGKDITCNDNSFSQLEFLRLVSLGRLERWHLGTSAMPLIKGLYICDCLHLKEIPERMKDMVKFSKSLYVVYNRKGKYTNKSQSYISLFIFLLYK
ncbi:disease resistance protein RPP13-like [Solanum stenotomum]|uniref:disease resistance protein RPP13-like n=1 Tax=Solanum stenotomum TaxID=172797 RepID=UPI0020CFF318|nr:disease resistance protein RPP13-like [Solanum stenotomum]